MSSLEELGWRQGSFVSVNDVQGVLGNDLDGACYLLAASQSCDIANQKFDDDPFVEFSVGRVIERLSPDRQHNKNPRFLHMRVESRVENTEGTDFTEVSLEFKAYEKVQVPKETLASFSPSNELDLTSVQLREYVAWLAARYSRPAHPTAFNDRLREADKKGRLKKHAKRLNESVTGIYVQVLPDAEIPEDQQYSVNLLCIMIDTADEHLTKINDCMASIAEIMKAAGMEVEVAILKEKEVSLQLFRRFKRLYFDDISFKTDGPLPAEVNASL